MTEQIKAALRGDPDAAAGLRKDMVCIPPQTREERG
jgi:hypothetical protein